jgi:choline dehydrogenase-like flavoprotein
MFLDGNAAAAGRFDRVWDVCVVGSGPAGMTLARRLAAQGHDVALMEAGGLEISWESQDFYLGDVVGMAYYDLDVGRLRTFGGTSQHWHGRSRPLEAYNFETLPYLPLSGWPISRADLDPYVEETDSILDLVPASAVPDQPVEDGLGDLVRIRFRHSTPTRFAEKFGPELQASERITLIYNAALVDLRLSEDMQAVTGAVFRPADPAGQPFTVTARHYALCLGGIETPRFLLNANSQMPMGIGNQNDQVGRYFSEHPTYRIADVLSDGTVPQSAGYMLTFEAMKRHEMLSCNLLLATQGHSLSRAALRSVACSSEFSEQLAARVLGRGIDCEREGLFDVLEVRRTGADQTGKLGIIIEQELNPDSRVMLGDDVDAFGQRRVVLDWRLTERDIHTMRSAAEIVGRSLAAQDYGRLKIRDWLRAEPADVPQLDEEGDHEVAIHHHLCTTRMSADPRTGVVDADCRVHGIDNLHISGGSVFATGGFANPTYPVVQLALRLGDHLGARLSTEPATSTDG